MAAPTGNTHVVITDRAIYYDTKTKGPIRMPWSGVWQCGYQYGNPWMRMDNGESLIMVHDKNTGEDKDAAKFRLKCFFADFLPFGTAAIQAEMQEMTNGGSPSRDIKKRERKLKTLVKWLAKGEKEKAKAMKKMGMA
jgi:hypothetical protein